MRNLFVLGVLFGLVLLAGGITQYRYRSYIDRAPAQQVPEQSEFAPVEFPKIGRMRSPHAILVLDVSGSMKDSDPSHLQSEAVLQFFSVYRDLGNEILAKGDTSRVAVVLFATIAQTIDWHGSGEPWLEASSSNTGRFRQAVEEYLGDARTEPRKGQETDYLSALEEVHRLADGLPSPPAIFFMTDGANEPHLLFTPGLPEIQRRAALAALPASQRQIIDAVSSAQRRWLRPKSSAGIFDRRTEGFSPLQINSSQRTVVRSAISEAVSTLLARRYALGGAEMNAPPFWAAVFLGIDSKATAGTDDVRELLAPAGSLHFMNCRDPRQLPEFFIRELANWLRLNELPVGAQVKELQLPKDTKAFAVAVETAGGKQLELASSGRVVPLSGRDGLWAGVASGGGTWRFQGDAGEIRRGQLFISPRYEWVLSVPNRVSVTSEKGSLDVRLFLFALDSEKPIVASRVYSNLPAALPMRIDLGDGERTFECRRLAEETEGGAAYQASIVIQPGAPRRAVIHVETKPLRDRGIAVSADRLSATIEIRPALRLDITNSSGRRVAPDLRNIPREADSVRQAVERWRRNGN